MSLSFSFNLIHTEKTLPSEQGTAPFLVGGTSGGILGAVYLTGEKLLVCYFFGTSTALMRSATQ